MGWEVLRLRLLVVVAVALFGAGVRFRCGGWWSMAVVVIVLLGGRLEEVVVVVVVVIVGWWKVCVVSAIASFCLQLLGDPARGGGEYRWMMVPSNADAFEWVAAGEYLLFSMLPHLIGRLQNSVHSQVEQYTSIS